MADSRTLEQILGRPDLTPPRYPGGRRKLALAVAGLLEHTGGPIELLVEPFAGGAAVSLALLEAGRVQSIALSDLDTLVGSFWQVVFSAEAPALAEQVARADITLKVWEDLRARARAEAFETPLERAYACLFLNRTSFSGILHKFWKTVCATGGKFRIFPSSLHQPPSSSTCVSLPRILHVSPLKQLHYFRLELLQFPLTRGGFKLSLQSEGRPLKSVFAPIHYYLQKYFILCTIFANDPRRSRTAF